jgi:MFS family permease
VSVLTTLLPPRAYRWNFVVMGLDYSLFLLALSYASAYGVLPLFVHHLTASNLFLGLIATVRAIGTSLPPILIAPHTERLRRKKPLLLFLTIFERLPYLVLALVTPLLAVSHPVVLLWTFFALIGIGTWFGGLGLPAWLDLMARMLPADWRGRFFGYAAAVGGLVSVAGAACATLLLRHFTWPNNFAICFACTAACLAVSFIFIASCREPAPAAESPAPTTGAAYWRRLPDIVRTDRNFARYLVAAALISISGMAVSFYTIDAKRTLHLADAGAGLYAVVLLASATLGNVLWGYLGDHIGHKHVVEGGALCTAAAALIALAARDSAIGIAAYGLVFVLVGLATSGIQLAAFTFVIDFAPVAQRPTYVGLVNLAIVPFAAGAPLVGGIIADHFGYPIVFILSALFAFAGAYIVLRHIIDPRMQARGGYGAE